MKKILDIYVDSSAHVALAVLALTRITGYYFEISVPLYAAVCIFFGTIVGYNFIKYAPLAPDFISLKNRYLKRLQFFSALCFVIAFPAALYFNMWSWLIMGIAAVLVFLYVYPSRRLSGNLRSYRGYKIYVVALVWAGVTTVLPAVEVLGEVSSEIVWESLRRAVFIVAITLPFEIRDLSTDHRELGTLPQKIGVKGAQWLGSFLLLIFWASGRLISVSEVFIWEEALVVLCALAFTWGYGSKQPRYYCSLGVESLPLLWWVLVWLSY